jgi:hypothetical protein
VVAERNRSTKRRPAESDTPQLPPERRNKTGDVLPLAPPIFNSGRDLVCAFTAGRRFALTCGYENTAFQADATYLFFLSYTKVN